MAGLVWVGWSWSPRRVFCGVGPPTTAPWAAGVKGEQPSPAECGRGGAVPCPAFPCAVAPLSFTRAVAWTRIGPLSTLSAASARARPETRALVVKKASLMPWPPPCKICGSALTLLN